MAIRSADQISIMDVTDAYSVILTSESHIFPGSISAALAGSITTQVIAMRGVERVQASVVVSEITKPTGVTVSSNGDATSPTLTIAVSTSVTSDGVVKIPVHIGDIVITKEFSFAIAFKGDTGATGAAGTSVTVTSTDVTYAVSNNTTQPTSWSETMPNATAGQYLWTKTVVTYSDGKSTTTYSYALQGVTGATGATGTSVTVSEIDITYGTSTSASTQPSSWDSTMPTVAEGSFLWTKTVTNFSDGKSAITYSYAKQGEKGDKGDTGATGAAGADAIYMNVTSSNGTIFKNSAIATVLTAHVYQAGKELSASEIAALGVIKWYKDGGTTAVATGTTLTIDAGDVTGEVSYIAQLEG